MWDNIYRIRSNATPGFYFSKLVFGWSSIQIWLTWGCIQDGALLIDSSFILIISTTLGKSLKSKGSINIIFIWFQINPDSRRCSYIVSFHGVHFTTSKMPKLAWVGLYSSWGCIVSKSVFDWGCITIWMGWGSFIRVGLHLRRYGISLKYGQNYGLSKP